MSDNPHGNNCSILAGAMSKEELLKTILANLPELIPRSAITLYLGKVISPRYLANLDSAGKGPKKIVMGRKVVYPKADLIDWLISRTKAA